MFEAFDFLPGELNPYLKGFIYLLIIVHLLAFVMYFVVACPSFFQKKQTFSDRVEKMIEKNKQKHL